MPAPAELPGMPALAPQAQLRRGDNASLHQRPARGQHRFQAGTQVALEPRRRAVLERPRSQQAAHQAIPQNLEYDLTFVFCFSFNHLRTLFIATESVGVPLPRAPHCSRREEEGPPLRSAPIPYFLSPTPL